MKKTVYIICTTHLEKGLTSVDDLHNHIREINPDCIYEEVPVNMA